MPKLTAKSLEKQTFSRLLCFYTEGSIFIILVVDKQLKLVGSGGNVLYKGVEFKASTAAARSWQ